MKWLACLLCSDLLLLFAADALAITIPTVPVGNAGNAADTEVMISDSTTGYGSVAYDYRIGTTEVTNAQYVDFLNAKAASDPLALYMESNFGGISRSGVAGSFTYSTIAGRENMPVVDVNWYDAIRFANWLHNGQGSGDTETGAYTLLGGTPTPSNGPSITRNPGAVWFLTSEDEWYKAAYHRNDGTTGNYWDYPTSTDSVPYSDQPPGSDAPTQSNTANFFKDVVSAIDYDDGFALTGSPSYNISQNYLTDAGAYTRSAGPYGSYDQGGNVWEWNESPIDGSFRGFRGGSWINDSNHLVASQRGLGDPTVADESIGFRVATVPEPSSVVLAAMGILGVIAYVRRKVRSSAGSCANQATQGLPTPGMNMPGASRFGRFAPPPLMSACVDVSESRPGLASKSMFGSLTGSALPVSGSRVVKPVPSPLVSVRLAGTGALKVRVVVAATRGLPRVNVSQDATNTVCRRFASLPR